MNLVPRKNPLLWAYLAGLVVIAIPVLAAFRLASVQSLQEQERRAALLAGEVLRRSHQVSAQMAAAGGVLTAPGAQPCSDRHLRLMARMTAENFYLVAVGYVENDRLMCSTFGRHGDGLPLGPPDYTSRLGYDVRMALALPGLTENKLLLSTQKTTGYTAMIHHSVPIDMLSDEPDVDLGLYSLTRLQPLMARGNFQPEWAARLDDAHEIQFSDNQHIVAIKRSSLYDYAAFAAIPASRADRGWVSLVLLLVPLGVGAGFVLALIAFRATRHQLSLPAQLKQGIRRGELFLVYQPVVDLATGRWVGAEALVRWRRADGELVPPDVFIPMAERNRLIERITAEVIAIFVRDLQSPLRSRPDFHVSLNLSAADLLNTSIVQTLHQAVAEAGLRSSNLHVEATERGLLDTALTQQILHALRGLGIQVAIDDFGTGYSSLSYLTTLEVDYLKIDKSFVDTIGTDAATSHVVAHIIEMAKSLKLGMIAEGVETQEQADYLRAQGVQHAQGWLFSRPLNPADLSRGLQAQDAAEASATSAD